MLEFNKKYTREEFFEAINYPQNEKTSHVKLCFWYHLKEKLKKFYIIECEGTKDITIKDFLFPVNNLYELSELFIDKKLHTQAPLKEFFQILDTGITYRNYAMSLYVNSIEIPYSKETISKLSKMHSNDIAFYIALSFIYKNNPFKIQMKDFCKDIARSDRDDVIKTLIENNLLKAKMIKEKQKYLIEKLYL